MKNFYLYKSALVEVNLMYMVRGMNMEVRHIRPGDRFFILNM
jgi:hypothetical protein